MNEYNYTKLWQLGGSSFSTAVELASQARDCVFKFCQVQFFFILCIYFVISESLIQVTCIGATFLIFLLKCSVTQLVAKEA